MTPSCQLEVEMLAGVCNISFNKPTLCLHYSRNRSQWEVVVETFSKCNTCCLGDIYLKDSYYTMD